MLRRRTSVMICILYKLFGISRKLISTEKIYICILCICKNKRTKMMETKTNYMVCCLRAVSLASFALLFLWIHFECTCTCKTEMIISLQPSIQDITSFISYMPIWRYVSLFLGSFHYTHRYKENKIFIV